MEGERVWISLDAAPELARWYGFKRILRPSGGDFLAATD
jgi:hypothetical protein